MKVAITIVVICYFSTIECIKRAEFNFHALLPQLGNNATLKNENLKKCVRDAGFNALDIKKRVGVAAGRIEKRLAHISNLSKMYKCFNFKTVEEIIIKWKQNYVDPNCLKTEYPALADAAMAEKLKKTVNDINRTIISFHKEVKKRVGERDPVIAMIKCFAYISKDDNLELIDRQRKCVKDESAGAGIEEVDVLSARGELLMKLGTFPIDEANSGAIEAAEILIAEAQVKFTKDEKHYDVDKLSQIAGFEDYAKAFHWEFVKYHLELLRVAKGDKSVATKLRTCFMLEESEEEVEEAEVEEAEVEEAPEEVEEAPEEVEEAPEEVEEAPEEVEEAPEDGAIG